MNFIKQTYETLIDVKVLVDDIDVVFHVAGVKGSPKRGRTTKRLLYTNVANEYQYGRAKIRGVDWYVYTSTG